jgi:selenocysteine-specific elongation factor
MFVLGTAGHIDHGKSLLVQALTGIDPDRLQEEKDRGMTIELGFAWLTLPGGRDVGIVDVPGHERFVKNMLAGVGGIDLALLIVAANEGVMPQTREHLAILDLLEVSRGIAVITKKDTGTLIDGGLAVGQEVEIVPSGLKSRIRGLQTHKKRLEKATPGSRVAANLVGINKAELVRGDVVTLTGWLKPSSLVTVKLKLISYLQRPLRHNATVSFHTGAAEIGAKVRLLEGDVLPPGGITWAQMALERPLAVVKGDHYIIRSPTETLGGGVVVETNAKRLRRSHPEIIRNLQARDEGTTEEAVLALLEAQQPREFKSLLVESKLTEPEVTSIIESLLQQGSIISIGQGSRSLLFTLTGWQKLVDRITKLLEEYHRKYPARAGMPRLELSNNLKLGSHAPAALERLTDQGIIVIGGGQVRLPSHTVKLTSAQQARLDAFTRALAENPYAPPSGLIPEPDLLNELVSQGKVVKISDTVVFAKEVYDDMVSKITARIKEIGKVGLGEVRDMFGTSRKYAQALLEYLDAKKVTRRVGDDRVLY